MKKRMLAITLLLLFLLPAPIAGAANSITVVGCDNPRYIKAGEAVSFTVEAKDGTGSPLNTGASLSIDGAFLSFFSGFSVSPGPGTGTNTVSLIVKNTVTDSATIPVKLSLSVSPDVFTIINFIVGNPPPPPPAAHAAGSTEQALPAASDGTPAVIVHGPAKLYDRADTGSAVLGTLPTGAEVLIQSGLGGMVLVTYHGNTRAAWVEEGKLAVR